MVCLQPRQRKPPTNPLPDRTTFFSRLAGSTRGVRRVEVAVGLFLPTVQIRQWVCTLPWGLRVIAGYDRRSCALLVDSFVRELQRRVSLACPA